MKIAIKNGLVISMNPNENKTIKKDIVITNNIITDITNNYTGKCDILIDAKNKIIMPGLINCHTHLGMSLFRATNDNMNLDDWLTKKIWPIEDKLTNDDMYYATMLSIIEMIKSGTTCANDMYYNCEGSLKAINESKIRMSFSRCLINDDENKIKEFINLYKNNKNDKVTFTVTPHSLYTCSKEYLIKCKNLADKYQLPIHIHLSENENEVEKIKKEYHKLPIEVLNDLGYLDNKLILAHSVFLEDKELHLLKDKNVSICHNPVSNLNLGCGIADITKYKDYVNICLGTDGQGSGNNLNMFYHMSLVDYLQKGIHCNPLALSSYDVLKMATINGAKALGLDKKIGSIEKGKLADIIILDMHSINTEPNIDIITNITHNAINNVDTVIIDGKILMQNKVLNLNVDTNDIIHKVNTIIRKYNGK